MPSFASLGTVLIDNFYYHHESPPRIERHLGGGGLYAGIGARIWLNQEDMVISVDGKRPGEDDTLSPLVRLLDDLGGDMWLWEADNGKEMLQAVIEYRGLDRTFSYLNPRPQATLACLPLRQISSLRVLHLCCTPTSLAESIAYLKGEDNHTRPIIVYEPLPTTCTPSHFPTIQALFGDVDIFSPNHEEMAAMLGQEEGTDSKHDVENLASQMHVFGARTVVVRAGSNGCYVSNTKSAEWIPAYFTLPNLPADQVKGTTGAGNSFLGGLSAGLVLQLKRGASVDVFEAAKYGSVSASFVVQQTGLPHLTLEKGEELWNGESATSRIERYNKLGQ